MRVFKAKDCSIQGSTSLPPSVPFSLATNATAQVEASSKLPAM